MISTLKNFVGSGVKKEERILGSTVVGELLVD
jgi:hypothetical protein